MSQIAEKRPSERIEKKITGLSIVGTRAGLKIRRKVLKKEDMIDSDWDESFRELIYKIKPEYKSTIEEWMKKERVITITNNEKSFRKTSTIICQGTCFCNFEDDC